MPFDFANHACGYLTMTGYRGGMLAMDFTANTVAPHSDSPGRQSIDEQLGPDPLQGDRT